VEQRSAFHQGLNAKHPWLQLELASIGGYRLYGFGFLQHASSIIGLALLALWT
jgi:hypothetical protein